MIENGVAIYLVFYLIVFTMAICNDLTVTELVGKKFLSFEEVNAVIEAWSKKFHQPIKLRSSHKLKPESYTEEIIKRFVKKDITWGCIHGGAPRDNKVDNSRKNQKTNCINCEFNCENIDPCTVLFAQDKMRKHYLECNTNNNFLI